LAAVDGPQRYRGFDVSGDGTRIVVSRVSNTGSALWMRDLSSTKETQITFDESYTPQLSADGTRLLFSGPGPAPPPKLFVRNLGTDSVTLVPAAANFASDWSGDGKAAVSVRIDRTNRLDVWYQLLPNGPEQRLPFNTQFTESQAKVSPDNRWIAFVTDRAGKDDVWVADFPSGENPGRSLPMADRFLSGVHMERSSCTSRKTNGS
jgi:Tol biopolymer transport system component